MSPAFNFKVYKKKIEKRTTPTIPYFAPLLRDLIFLYEASSEYMTSQKCQIDFNALQILGKALYLNFKFQRIPFSLETDPETRFLLVKAPVIEDEDVIYALSLQCEPLSLSSSSASLSPSTSHPICIPPHLSSPGFSDTSSSMTTI